MQCIYKKSTIYAEYNKKIFYITNCDNYSIESIEQQSEKIIAHLTRHGAIGYTLHAYNTSTLFTPEALALRTAPSLGTNSIQPDTSTIAAIVDIDYTNSGEPIAEIIIKDIPPYANDEELSNCISEVQNTIIRIEKEYSRYTNNRNTSIHYRTPHEECNEHEFIAADLIFGSTLAQEQETPESRLLIDENFDIHLPQFPQIIIELAPLPKALYILLLLHPEGFELKKITNYTQELRKIYSTISGRQNVCVINKMLDSITNPCDNPLHKNLSIIRRAFLSKLRSDIAENYIPTHGRNTIHRVPLKRGMIELPEALTYCL